ncbi:MAG: substrate-binding domain-containing protein [Desulfurococcaceae archaeon]
MSKAAKFPKLGIVAIVEAVIIIALAVIALYPITHPPTAPPAEYKVPKLGDKFRPVPIEFIRALEKEYATIKTPRGPNNETPLSGAQLALSPEEKELAKQLKLKEYYYLVATPDPTEILNIIGMNDVLRELGFSDTGRMDAWSISEQIAQVETLIAKARDISFIVGEAYEAVTLGEPFVRLANAGVPQVHVWTTPEGLFGHPNYIGLIDADGYAQGAIAAEILAYMMNYRGEVGIVKFGLVQWTNVMRYQGAIDVFNKYPDIKIVAEVAFTDVGQCHDLVVGMLQAHPEIDAIWATWMIGPATGAASAIIALGLVGQVIVAAPDLGGLEGARAIADPENPIVGAGEADLIDMGRNMVYAAMKWLIGKREEVHNGYFVSRAYPVVAINLIEMWYKTGNNRYYGDLPEEVVELLRQQLKGA